MGTPTLRDRVVTPGGGGAGFSDGPSPHASSGLGTGALGRHTSSDLSSLSAGDAASPLRPYANSNVSSSHAAALTSLFGGLPAAAAAQPATSVSPFDPVVPPPAPLFSGGFSQAATHQQQQLGQLGGGGGYPSHSFPSAAPYPGLQLSDTHSLWGSMPAGGGGAGSLSLTGLGAAPAASHHHQQQPLGGGYGAQLDESELNQLMATLGCR